MARIGLAFNGPPYHATTMIEAVKQAERVGFDSAWQAEDVYGPDAISLLACYAYATERLRLGTCLIGVNTRDPCIVANSFATLDQISRGRMIIGLGAALTWLPLIGKKPEDVKSLTLI